MNLRFRKTRYNLHWHESMEGYTSYFCLNLSIDDAAVQSYGFILRYAIRSLADSY